MFICHQNKTTNEIWLFLYWILEIWWNILHLTLLIQLLKFQWFKWKVSCKNNENITEKWYIASFFSFIVVKTVIRIHVVASYASFTKDVMHLVNGCYACLLRPFHEWCLIDFLKSIHSNSYVKYSLTPLISLILGFILSLWMRYINW